MIKLYERPITISIHTMISYFYHLSTSMIVLLRSNDNSQQDTKQQQMKVCAFCCAFSQQHTLSSGRRERLENIIHNHGHRIIRREGESTSSQTHAHVRVYVARYYILAMHKHTTSYYIYRRKHRGGGGIFPHQAERVWFPT